MSRNTNKLGAIVAAALSAALLSGAGIASAASWTVSGETIPNQTYYINALPHAPGDNIEGNSLTVTDGTFTGNFFGLLSYSSSGLPLGSYKNNTMTINSGNFDYVAIYNNNLTVQEVPAGQGSGNNIIINGGNFNCTYGSNSDSGFRTYQGDIVINGGTFGGEAWKMQTTGVVEIHDGDLSNLRTINANGVTIDGGNIAGVGDNPIALEFFENGGTTQNLPAYSVNITGGTFGSGLKITPAYGNYADGRTLNIENVEIPFIELHGANAGYINTMTLDGVTTKIQDGEDYIRVIDLAISNSDLSGSDEVEAENITIENSTTEGVIKFLDAVKISGSTHTGNITTTGTATERTVTIEDGSTVTGNLIDTAAGLSLSLSDSVFDGSIDISGTITAADSEMTGDASTKGGFSFDGATVGGTFTGYAGNTSDITNKTFTATDSNFAGAVSFVGDGGDFSISGSSLDLTGSTFADAVTAFHAATVENCTVTATGATFGGNIFLTDALTATGNTLNLFTGAGLNAGTVISANANAYGTNTGNTLNIKNVLGATAGNLVGWQNINIYVPATAAKGDTVLTLAGGNPTDLSGTTIRAGIDGDIDFVAGDEITLLSNAAGLTTDGTTYGTLTSGVSLIYDGLAVKKKDDNNIILTIPAAPAPDPVEPDPVNPDPQPQPNPPQPAPAPAPRPRVNPEIKSLLSGQMAAAEMVTEAVEIGDAVRDAEVGENIFGVISGAGIGSDDVKSRNAHFVAGWKRADKEETAAAYVQYGRGSYDSTLAGIDASGNASLVGVGGYYGRNIGKDAYIDCGLNVGQVWRDYHGSGFSTVIDSASHEKEKSAYVGGFLRVGKSWNIQDGATVGAYMQYSAAHVGGYDSRLSSGEAFSWSDVTRHGLTVGATMEKRLDKKGKIHGDLSITQNLGGTAAASFKNGEVSEDTKGAFAALSVGWKQEINDRQNIDLSIRGLAGHRSGVAANVTYSVAF